MQASNDDNRYAPPQAPVSDIRPSTEAGILATRSRRFAGGLIDGVVVLGILGLIAWLTPWNPFIPKNEAVASVQLLPALVGFVCFLLLHGYLLVTRGQTIGKALLGMRIVRTDGTPASVGRLLGLRYGIGSIAGIIPVVAQIYSLIDCLLIFRKSHQCLHDQIADTVVIRI